MKFGKEAKVVKTFDSALSDLEKDSAAVVKIYIRSSGPKPRYLDTLEISDMIAEANIEDFLKRSYGGGDFELCVVSGPGAMLAKDTFFIAGLPKEDYQLADSRKAGPERSNPDREVLVQVMGKLADAAISRQGNSGEEMERTLRIAKELRSDDGDIKELQKDFMSMSIQNLMTPKETQIEEFLKIYQLIQQIQPTLQPEDPMNNLIGLVGPLVTQALSAKMSGGSAQPSPAQLQQIQGYLQQAGIDPAALQGLQQPGQQLAGSGMAAVPKPDGVSHPEEILEKMLQQFRQNIRDDAPAKALAKQIVDLMGSAITWTPENPPPILRGLIFATTPAEFEPEIKKFFAAIPELAGNAELQAQIKLELLKIAAAEMKKRDVKADVETAPREESPAPVVVTDSPEEIPTPNNIAEAAAEVEGL